MLKVLQSSKAKFAAGIGASVAYLAFLEFANRDSWIHCPIRALTGHKCPGCGLQTALFDLMHGDVAGAFASNQLLFIAPVFIGAGYWAQKKVYCEVDAPAAKLLGSQNPLFVKIDEVQPRHRVITPVDVLFDSN